MNSPVKSVRVELPDDCLSVAIGQWRVAKAPVGLRSILGSCMGVVLHDRLGQICAMAHILLPDSRGAKDNPGRYADTAIPGMVEELSRLRGPAVKTSLVAKIAGGASMFETQGTKPIGDSNRDAVRRILDELRITVIAADTGGDYGRNVVFNPKSGKLYIKRPGAEYYEI